MTRLPESTLEAAVIAVGTFAILTVAMSWVQFRFPRVAT